MIGRLECICRFRRDRQVWDRMIGRLEGICRFRRDRQVWYKMIGRLEGIGRSGGIGSYGIG